MILSRAVVGVLIIMAALVVLAIMRLDSISVLAVPGNAILFTFYTNSAYASPLPILILCTAIMLTAIRTFRRTRTFAVCLLILLPLVPYGVVEGQTLLFGRYFADFLRHEDRVDREKCKVLSIGPSGAIIGVEDFPRNLYYLEKVNGKWRIEDSRGIKGEYIGVFPPYPRLDW